MIEEPPKLVIKKPCRRPTAAQIEAFKDVPSSFVVDAMDGLGALDPQIKALGSGDMGSANNLGCVAVGPALTVETGPADILALLAALAFIEAGDVVVSSFAGFQGCAAAGDRLIGMMLNNDAAGFVVDGPIRDLVGVVDVGLPVWCTGINPNSPVGQGPGRVGMPIHLGGRQVQSGDMIVADRDGVVVVPFDEIDAVIRRLPQIVELELALDQEVQDGLKIPAAITELLAGEQVRYVD